VLALDKSIVAMTPHMLDCLGMVVKVCKVSLGGIFVEKSDQLLFWLGIMNAVTVPIILAKLEQKSNQSVNGEVLSSSTGVCRII